MRWRYFLVYRQCADRVGGGQFPDVVEGFEELGTEASHQFRGTCHNGIGGLTKENRKHQRLSGV